MQKSIRSFALVAILAITAVPTMHAGVMGTNPRPQAVQTPSLMSSLGYAILAYLGV